MQVEEEDTGSSGCLGCLDVVVDVETEWRTVQLRFGAADTTPAPDQKGSKSNAVFTGETLALTFDACHKCPWQLVALHTGK